jgi:hypothetical protein
MKTLAFFILLLLLGAAVSAQTPQSFRYQAVARDNSGNVLSNQAVSFRISILNGSISGAAVYSETHNGKSTNAFGLVELEIGKGTPVTGTFSSIDWSGDIYFVKVEMDPAGGSLYQVLSTSQLLSVPYALFAKNVENNNDADASPTNEIQNLTLSGKTLGITNGNTVELPAETGDNWGNQVIVTDASLTGNGLTANPLKVPDNSITSVKIQDSEVSGIDLADNAVSGVKVQDGTISTADLSNLAINAEKLAAASVITDKINNSAVTSEKLASNSVTAAKIAEGAVTGDKIAQAGATNGQALKWNGTTWAPAADATGGGGWTDDGEVVRMTTTTDTVQIGSVKRLGRFNVGGDIGLNLLNSIYFGSDATRISSMTGGDLRFVAEDLSILTTEDITFGRYGDETWIKFDNANKRVGIGTLSPTDRLHVVLDDAAMGLSAVRGVATSTAGSAYGVYGQSAGFKGRGLVGEATGTNSIGVMGLATNTSSTGVWGEGSNQGVYGKSDLATGKGIFGQVTSATGYSGYFDGGKFYVSGNTGIGTTTPAKKLHVYGSAQVKDTLYASAVKISNSTRVFYKNSSTGSPKNISTMESWGPLDSIVVVAPGPGSVLLNVTGFLSSLHTYLRNSWVYVGISAIRRSSNYDDALSMTNWQLQETLVGGLYKIPCAVTAVASVTSAGTYKYYIVGWFNELDSEEDLVNFGGGAISALFIPSP